MFPSIFFYITVPKIPVGWNLSVFRSFGMEKVWIRGLGEYQVFP